jgi:hypothetical protein
MAGSSPLPPSRRAFVGSAAAAAGALVAGPALRARALRALAPGMRYGMVTYLWGKDLGLDALLAACGAAGLEAVELRTQHAHGVEPTLDAAARRELRARLNDSPVALIGLGSDERFDSPDPARLAAAVAATKGFLRLSADLGGTGVKVKPDSFHKDVPRERTIAQIGGALRELAPFAQDLGQELRLEVHGSCADPRTIAAIVAHADHPAVRVCWNCNAQDTKGLGLHGNFALLRPRFGGTLHAPPAEFGDYPLAELVALCARSDYRGCVLLETHDAAPQPLAPALRRQRARFVAMQEAAAAPSVDAAPTPLPVAIAWDAAASAYAVTAAGAPFATLRLGADQRVPCVHPIHAPSGALVTRGFPLAPGPRDATDHPHHRGLWLAHGDVDGRDFWHAEDCRIEVLEHAVDGAEARFVAAWRAAGATLLVERRRTRFLATARERRIETHVELHAEGAAVTLGDTKEGSFALRLGPTLSIDGKHGRGRLEDAAGRRDGDVWGRRAEWVLAEGPVDGRLVRVTMRDDAGNPWRPTWWHARGYGLLAMNPFGRRAFEGKDAPVGAVTIRPDEPLRFGVTVVVAD